MFLSNRSKFWVLQKKTCLISLSLLASVMAFSCHVSTKKKISEKPVTISKKTTSSTSFSTIEASFQKRGLVNIRTLDPNLMVDLKYSTKDNFFGEDVYGDLKEAYLQTVAANALAKANKELMKKYPTLRLLVYDAARPLSIQRILWSKLDSIPPKKRKDFVADPAEGSIHNFGCAVDLTLYNISTKKTLDMGTSYDFFGYLAYPRLEKEFFEKGKLSAQHLKNRAILRKTMQNSGFQPISSEWWHFNFYDRENAKRKFKILE
jgi:zinc D-Ala-D-Ala dipeptidase